MKKDVLKLSVVALALFLATSANASTAYAESCCISSRCPKVKGMVVTFGVFPKDHIISVPEPAYPAMARAAKVSGEVQVEVLIGRKGAVVRARIIEGHPLLRRAVLEAACGARFKPIKLSGRAVNVWFIITYNFHSE